MALTGLQTIVIPKILNWQRCSMLKLYSLLLSVAMLAMAATAPAQGTDAVADLQHKLLVQYPLTRITSDKSNVVTAGTILVLQKNGLWVYPANVSAAPENTYKNGKLGIGFGDSLKVDTLDGMTYPGGASAIPKKQLVSGEKFWLYAAQVQKDKVELAIITEPYDDGRYVGLIKIPFAKGTQPSADDLFRMISEVVTVQPGDNSQQPAQQTAAVASPTEPPPPTMAPYAPPPPPPDAQQAEPAAGPKTIALGQTKDTVVSNFGQPQKVVKLTTKEIDYYSDMKVTFVDGKVTNVE